MHLSFQFNDFFRERTTSLASRTDVSIPTFLVQSGVIGDLKIKDARENLLRAQDARIEVKLEGFMKTEMDTRIESHPEFRLVFEKKILSMTQAFPMEGHASDEATNERHYPFKFNVKSWLEHDLHSSDRHRCLASRNNFVSLPPSLQHEILATSQGAPRSRTGAQVKYKLTAHLFKDRKLVDRIMQPILLLISHDPPPPMCMTDFVGEYCMAQKCTLRGPLFQKAGLLSILAQEPKQMTVKADCLESMVELPVRLVWTRQKQEINVYQAPKIEAEVRWQFRLSTFVSVKEQQGPATLKDALLSPATALVRSALPPKTLSMVWRTWTAGQSEGASTSIESDQSLRLTIPRSEILTPTFWSPFLSRRYSVWLQVKVNKPGNAKLEVEVPIQVGIEAGNLPDVNGTPRMGSNELFDNTDCDELLPQYSRTG